VMHVLYTSRNIPERVINWIQIRRIWRPQLQGKTNFRVTFSDNAMVARAR